MIRAAIFDMDGLLVDSEPLWQVAEIEAFESVGVRLTRAQCTETKGRRVDETVAYWHARRPFLDATPEEVERRLVARVAELIRERGEVKEGARHALAFFRRKGLRRALASSSARLVIDAALSRLHLQDEFDVVHSAVDEEFGKPHPAVYLTTAARLGVEPHECIALEDSLHGVLAAQAAGMRCVAVPDDSSGDADRDREMSSPLVAADLVLPSLLALDEEVWTLLAGLEG